jgi:transposase InsO family protein
VEHVKKKFGLSEFGLSERRACRAIGQPRSTQRYVDRKLERDLPLLERMATLSRENPRYGYRRVWALLKREGWTVNRKRIQRLWREADLKVLANRKVSAARSPKSTLGSKFLIYQASGLLTTTILTFMRHSSV